MNLPLFVDKDRNLFPMRFYQEPCISEFRQGIKEGHLHSIGQAPCRFGKTVVSAHLLYGALIKGSRCLFAAPRISLVEQTLASFEAQGLRDIGVMQANHYRTDMNAQLQIACFDTLYKRDSGNFDVVILDEVHLCDARMWELKKKWKIVLGWTATPWTKGLGLHFSKLHTFATIPQMIGYNAIDRTIGLVPGRGIGPRADLIAGVENIRKNDAGEFVETDACAFMDRDAVIADEVDTWLRTRQEGKHPGDRTFHFIRRRASAKARMERFAAAGVQVEYIDAFTDDRSPIFERFRRRQTKVILSVGCLTTGVDADVRCIIDAAPSNSESTIVQKLMRGGTPAEGKEYYWLNDHAGNANRFGWYEDIFHDKLDTTPPHVKGCAYQQEEAPPTEKKQKDCPVCRSLLRRGALSCSNCGHQVVEDTTVVVQGELGELVPQKKGKEKKEKKREYTMQEKSQWMGGFMWLARERGYSEGWASWRYKEKFGCWPQSVDRTPRPPSFECEQFDRHCRIKHAKAQEKERDKGMKEATESEPTHA